MPAITRGATVLVTGANGYIATFLIQALLDTGYKVKGTVRDTEKGDYLVKAFATPDFTYTLVKDVVPEGAFDQAVEGVDAVAHLATFVGFPEDPEQVIKPAVEGTRNILKSVQAHNPTAKRILLTSSVAAARTLSHPPPFSEADWSNELVALVKRDGVKAPGSYKYAAAKTLSEKAFWKFFEDEKPAFDGVSLNPAAVLGPFHHQPGNAVTGMLNFVVPWLTGKKTSVNLPHTEVGTFVDVRDLALAYVSALEKPEAAGERFIISDGPFSMDDVLEVVHSKFPDLPHVPQPREDLEAREKTRAGIPGYTVTKSQDVLGVKYRGLESTVVDMTKALRERLGF